MTTILISERAACRVLAEIGLAREQGRLVLACGLAGRPRPLGVRRGYDADAVRALARRPLIVPADLPTPVAPGTILVLRQRRGVAPGSPWRPEELVDAPLPLGRSARIWLDQHARMGSPRPCLVTVAGFVAGGFDIVGAPVRGGMTQLRAAAPGDWFHTFRAGRLLPTPGREWTWWPPLPPDDHFTQVDRRTAVRTTIPASGVPRRQTNQETDQEPTRRRSRPRSPCGDRGP